MIHKTEELKQALKDHAKRTGRKLRVCREGEPGRGFQYTDYQGSRKTIWVVEK